MKCNPERQYALDFTYIGKNGIHLYLVFFHNNLSRHSGIISSDEILDIDWSRMTTKQALGNTKQNIE